MKPPKLTPEERKTRASNAAKVMWENKRKAAAAASAPVEAPTAPQAVLSTPPPSNPPRRPKSPVIPKEFRSALSYAEKRLAKAMHERTAAMNNTAALNTEIEYLIQNIRALGGTPNVPRQTVSNPAYSTYMTTQNQPGPDIQLPPLPVAQGGAVDLGEVMQDNLALPETGLIGGGQWV